MTVLKTNVSQAYWCQRTHNNPYYKFDDASWEMPPSAELHGSIAWLDNLFEGGIVLPDDPHTENSQPRAITMLISGPPGSGKSVLAMELCYRWSMFGRQCFYVSTETS